jgi:hypothetical protein
MGIVTCLIVTGLAEVGRRSLAGPGGKLRLHILGDHLLLVSEGEYPRWQALQVAGLHERHLLGDRCASTGTVTALGVVGPGKIRAVVVAAALGAIARIRIWAAR